RTKPCSLFFRAGGVTGPSSWVAAQAANRDCGLRTKRGKAIPNSLAPASAESSYERFGSEGTRNSEVVQCFEGLRVHPTSDWRRFFRALLRHHDGRLQVPQ